MDGPAFAHHVWDVLDHGSCAVVALNTYHRGSVVFIQSDEVVVVNHGISCSRLTRRYVFASR